jgi:glycosyltransferase involved in cell wall biosynthesis
VDFIGKFHNTSFDTSNPNYLGEIKPREKLFSMLTNYANMVLLSTGENGTPLVIKEALACGLGIVFSEYACSELNLDLPFIDLIPEAKIDDLDYINSVIKKNRERCIPIRNDIRKYALENFSWDGLVDVYIDNINKIKK